jgi:hypothetical protein
MIGPFLVAWLGISAPLIARQAARAARIASRNLIAEGAVTQQAGGERLFGLAEEAGRLWWKATVGSTSPWFAEALVVLVGLAAAVFLTQRFGRTGKHLVAPRGRVGLGVLFTVVAVYLLNCAFFFDVYFTRLFLPFAGLQIVVAAALLCSLIDLVRLGPWARTFLRICLFSGLALGNLAHFKERSRFMPGAYFDDWKVAQAGFRIEVREGIDELIRSSYSKSWAREVWDLLGDPACSRPIRRGASCR